MMNGFLKKTDGLPEKMKSFRGSLPEYLESGSGRSRRAIHALKVGFSLTLVSLLYLMEPLFKGVGQNVIWAVMTVVVVLEFTAGATLCKGINRGFGTLLAGSLAFLFEFIARKYGKVFRAVFIGASIFLVVLVSRGLTETTWSHMILSLHRMKNYDYGVLVFLLTFNLITVSSYRVDDIVKLARGRIYMIAIGSGVCIFMSLFIFPYWSGEDLHNSTISKIEGLAKSIEACVGKYFNDEEPNLDIDETTEDPIYNNYKAVLDSKSTDETLARHASWEPRHSWHCHKFPSQQYVKVGGVLRHFGYAIVALHGSLQTEIRTPRSVRWLFKDPCIRLVSEVTKALTELADSIRNRQRCSPEILTENLQQALQDLDSALKSQPRLFLGPNSPNNTAKMLAVAAATARQKTEKHLSGLKTESPRFVELKSEGGEKRVLRPSLSKIAITSLEFSEALPFAAFAALLVESVARLDVVIEEVEELGRVACFKEFKHDHDVILNVDSHQRSTTEIYLPNSTEADITMMNGFRKKTDRLPEKMKRFPVDLCRNIWKVGRDDPRRAIHALKVGFSLTLVSLLYLMEPLFKGVGQNAIWAVMTVVVVLEFTAGATLCKGINRGFGTLLAGSLAFLFEFIAREYGKVFRAVFIGASIFLVGTLTTYLRFFPNIKKNYDYGVLIFLLTFNLITVSSYRVDDILKLAQGRIYTIAIGSGSFHLPVLVGEDLHNSTISKIEGLAKSIEACVVKYFNDEEPDLDIDETTEDPIYNNYKAVLDSKSTDETLARHASWEPRHSWHCHKFPSQQYLKVGGVLRHFGYAVVALHGSLQTEIRTPRSVRLLFKDPCIRLVSEVTKALTELADSIRNRRRCSPEILTENLQQALQDLDSALKSQPRLFLGPSSPNNTAKMLAVVAATARQRTEKHLSGLKTESPRFVELKSEGGEKRVLRPTLSKLAITSLEFSEALPFAAFAALLVESVARLDVVIEEVEELGRVACFKEFKHDDDVILNVDSHRRSTTEINLPNSTGAE
ncbi:hypothetical protein OSB04_022357 [Centaurea solstitialis]|uniref:Aluminum-activated malate transporter n=1 Tax=Centaurea solstitialis TaxID=347529 RepID=A0AA38WH62_9ASTR|nr:hypothetical protein OSB04_022357 [Centaurea solstitialis]